MQTKLFVLAILLLGASISGCKSDPACTAEQSQSCTDMFTACQARCDPASAECMNQCAQADCNCHANYGCPNPSGC